MRRDKPTATRPIRSCETPRMSPPPNPGRHAPPAGGAPVPSRRRLGTSPARRRTTVTAHGRSQPPSPRRRPKPLHDVQDAPGRRPRRAFADAGPARRTRGQAEPGAKPMLPSPQDRGPAKTRRPTGRRRQARRGQAAPRPETEPRWSRPPARPAVRAGGWWSRTESNRRPPACKAGALPTELRPLKPAAKPVRAATGPGRQPPGVVGLGRLELPTSRLSGVRSNRLSYRPPAVDTAVADAMRPATPRKAGAGWPRQPRQGRRGRRRRPGIGPASGRIARRPSPDVFGFVFCLRAEGIGRRWLSDPSRVLPGHSGTAEAAPRSAAWPRLA